MAKMQLSKDKLQRKLTPGGIYEVHMGGFKPARSKSNPDNINLNPILKIINHPDFSGKPIFVSLPRSEDWMIQDFVHCLGLTLDSDNNIPGEWDFAVEQNPETWKYRGPLVGRTGKMELIETEYQGKPQLKVKQMICGVTNCRQLYPAITHSANMVKG